MACPFFVAAPRLALPSRGLRFSVVFAKDYLVITMMSPAAANPARFSHL